MFHAKKEWLSVQTHNAGGVSSNPARVTVKVPLVKKTTGNHLIKSNSLLEFRALSLVSAVLEIEFVMSQPIQLGLMMVSHGL